MLHIDLSVPRATVWGPAPRWPAWLRRAWAALARDDEDRELSEACDHADLERQLRRLERGRADRFGPLPP